MEEIDFILEEAKESMDKAVAFLSSELQKIRAGKASPDMLSSVSVEYYGAMTPLSQVSSVNTPDARTLVIKPFEKSILQDVERAIMNSDLGLNPQNDGDIIRISVPALTEERRKDLVKKSKSECENGRVTLRSVRKDMNNDLKKLLKDGAPEDAIKGAEDSVQKITDSYNKKIDELFAQKEIDIMTI